MENDFNKIYTLAAKHFFRDFKLKGGTQKKIARKLGITNSYVSAVINGSKTASLTLLEQIAFMLSGKPLDEFLLVGRRIKNGLPPTQEEPTDSPDSPAELISKLTYYIVDHERIKKELENNQWLLHESLNMADYAIVVASTDKRVLAYNTKYQETFDYPDEILATMDMGVYVKWGRNLMLDLEQFDKDISEAFVAESPISHIVKLKDGRKIKRDVYPLIKDGKLAGRLAHLKDITSTKKKKANKTDLA